MMEETDDTNGESTFEFVGEKEEGLNVTEASKASVEMSSTQQPSTTALSSTPSESSQAFLTMTFGDSSQDFLSASNQGPVAAESSTFATPVLPPPEPLPSFASDPHTVDTSISQTPGGDGATLPPPPPPPTEPFVGRRTLPLSYPYTYGRPNVQPSLETQVMPPNQPSLMTPTPVAPTAPPPQVLTPSAAVDLPLVEDPGFSVVSQNRPAEHVPESGGGAGGGGVWGFLNKVAEKAKNSVDSVITTLDPGMKEFIYSGGDIDIIVASDKEAKVSPIREAFQQVFGRATVDGMRAEVPSVAAQPVGYIAGLKGAEERINFLRQQGAVHVQQPLIALENFIVESTPERWYDVGCLILQDPVLGVTLHAYTQATPVPAHYIAQMHQQTPPDYPLRWSGLAVTVGQVVSLDLGVHHAQWHEALTGVTRKEMIYLAARSLAGIYKRHLGR